MIDPVVTEVKQGISKEKTGRLPIEYECEKPHNIVESPNLNQQSKMEPEKLSQESLKLIQKGAEKVMGNTKELLDDFCHFCCTLMPKSEMKAHRAEFHSGKHYPCAACDVILKTQAQLQAHRREVHNRSDFPCTECDYAAPTLQDSKAHRKAAHNIIRFSCHYCDYVGKVKRNLHLHVKHNHADLF